MPTRSKPGPEDHAFIQILKTADALTSEVNALLKPAGLTLTQYNVLRILRGAHPDRLSCSQAAERMITRDPDITRLMDRLEARQLIVRERDTKDRRHVGVGITDAGLKALSALDLPISNLHRRQFGRLAAEDVQILIAHLERVSQRGE